MDAQLNAQNKRLDDQLKAMRSLLEAQNKRLDDQNQTLNKRLDDQNQTLNKRLDDQNKRLDEQTKRLDAMLEELKELRLNTNKNSKDITALTAAIKSEFRWVRGLSIAIFAGMVLLVIEKLI